MTREELIERVNKFQGANREFSQELPPIVEALCDEIDEAGVEVVDNLTSNARDKALSANMGKVLKTQVDEKIAFPEVSGEAGQFLGVDAEGNPEWQPVSSTGEPADAEMSDTSTNAVQNKVITEELDKYAKKDGYYDSLTAGLATNLVDTKGTGTEQEFIRRTSCGDESISDDGTGVIQEIKGCTKAINQLIENPKFTTTGWWSTVNGSLSIIGGKCYFTFAAEGEMQVYKVMSTIAGHKYFVIQSYGDKNVAAIVTASGSTFEFNCRGIRLTAGATVEMRYAYFTDLTLAGFADYTLAQILALYPNGFGAYNAGVLKSNDAAALETGGFNEIDTASGELSSQYFGHYYVNNDGTLTPLASNNAFRVKVFPNTTYYYKKSSGENLGGPGIIRFEDADKNFISVNVSGYSAAYVAFTTPVNAAYMVISVASGVSYAMQLNLSWSGYRNGEYEPYWQRVLALRLSELTGIPEGGTEADRVTMFPNGAGGDNTSYDSIVDENGVGKGNNRRKRVNLGDLTWNYSSGYVCFYVREENLPAGFNRALLNTKVINSKYAMLANGQDDPRTMQDKVMQAYSSFMTQYLLTKDTAYTDADTFKAAMDGVYLEYELATPIVYTDLQYADGTPFTMPKVYQVADFGTETIVQPEGATEPSAPFRAVIKYNNDLTREIVNLPKNYDTTDGIDALCSALATALSSALNGTLTITRDNYSESDKRYGFTVTFTPNE